MSDKRFRIAFSFAGEKRDFVAQVAAILAKRFGKKAILYDKYHEAEFARRDLGIYLPELYHKQAELIVVVLCPDYQEKEWCGLEWVAIHALLKNRKDESVMFTRFEQATVKGLYDTAGFVELDEKTPAEAAELILERLKLIESKSKTFSFIATSKPVNLLYNTLDTLFKGRDEFLNILQSKLRSKPTAIHGMGGAGKTRASIEYAWRHSDEYNALLFVSADSSEALQRNLAQLCGPLVLNLPEQNEKDQNIQSDAVFRWLQQHPGWLLIFDNVDTKESSQHTESLLKYLRGGHVIITTRIADWSAQVAELELDVLSEDAAADFLLERTSDRRISAPDDSARARELARRLDCLALALEQAAAYIREKRITFADYIKRWRSVPAQAIKWHDVVKMQYPKSLAITHETSLAQLSPGARELFRALAWLSPDPIPISALEHWIQPGLNHDKSEEGKIASGNANANSGSDVASRQDVGAPGCLSRDFLVELENLHLARILDDGQTFTIHRVVQVITRQKQTQSDPPPALVAALNWINDLFIGDPDDVRTWPVLDPLASHAESVAIFAADHNIPDPTDRLLNHVALLLKTKAQHKAAEPLLRRALVIDEATFGKDHPKVAIDLNNLAQLLKDTNRLSEAEPLMRQVVEIIEKNFGGNHPKTATALNNLASLLQATNRLPEAEPLMRRALAIDEASFGKDHPKVAIRLNNLAMFLQATGRMAEAELFIHRALAIDEVSFGMDHPRVAIHLNVLASLLEDTNRLAEAEPLMRRALAIDEASFGKDHPDVARDLNNLGQLLKATNRLSEAEPLMRRMLEIIVNFTRTSGHPHPHLEAGIGNYRRLLMKMGGSQAQAEEKIEKLLSPLRSA